MNKKFGILAVFFLFAIMINPAYADVTSVKLEKAFYTTDEKIKFVGTQDGKDTVFVIIHGPSGDFKGMLADPSPDQGEFAVIPQDTEQFFDVEGIYNATAFTDDQKESEGIVIQLEFNGNQVMEVADFVLQIKSISD
ncbi:MAG: hypothetical protein R3327_04605, partial [Nitrosopumilaceae archaeon]|nr:hypothetical protein [Nitrosopumilaceae archaeon]